MQIDHIRPLARGGTDDLENLAFSCPRCNGSKATKLVAIDPVTGTAVPLYNPRTQTWNAHFVWLKDATRLISAARPSDARRSRRSKSIASLL